MVSKYFRFKKLKAQFNKDQKKCTKDLLDYFKRQETKKNKKKEKNPKISNLIKYNKTNQ